MAAPRDRRYLCAHCGIKWFIPAGRVHEPELTSCSSCDGPVLPLVDGADGAPGY